MITNDRQYKIVKSQIESFQESLDQLSVENGMENVHPKILEAEKRAIAYQLKELMDQAREYEALKEGKVVVTEVKSILELPVALIRARIANGMTQAELASKLGLKEQQIQRYEADMYETANVKTLQKVADVLRIKVNADVQIKSIDAPPLYDMAKYPFKQMFQRGWFANFRGTFNEAVKNSIDLLTELYIRAGLKDFQHGLTRKSIRTGSVVDEFALNAWYARVLIKAREQDLDNYFDKGNLTDIWFRQLVHFSIDKTGPLAAVHFLRENGIRVVFEPHLEGTHLDGAALLMDDIYPIIALTLRHDRLDNFWFVLFHELAHVVLHLNSELDMIFDDLDVNLEGIEMEADKYALNIAISDQVWKKSIVRFSPSKEAIINQAKSLKIHPAIIAGRLRRETGKYYEYGDLVGQGEVRELFADEMFN